MARKVVSKFDQRSDELIEHNNRTRERQKYRKMNGSNNDNSMNV